MIDGFIHQAERMLVSYVESVGCMDLTLKLSILDLRTRFVELDTLSRAENTDSGDVRRLEELVREARDTVIRNVVEECCKDIELKIKVLDLETRIEEKRKMMEAHTTLA